MQEHGTDGNYEIIVKGHLSSNIKRIFAGFVLTDLTHGETLIQGHIEDQAALHSVLSKVRDLALEIISVRINQSGSEETR